MTSSTAEDIPIYNYVSSVEKPLTWGEFTELNIRNGFDYPFSSAIWYLSFHMHKLAWVNRIYTFFLHLLPAMLIDLLLKSVGRAPHLRQMYKKIHKFSNVISYFCTNEWVRKQLFLSDRHCDICLDHFSFLLLLSFRCSRIQMYNDCGRKSGNVIRKCSISIWKTWIGWNTRIITSEACGCICSKMTIRH